MGFVFPSPATARAGQHKNRQGFCPKAREDDALKPITEIIANGLGTNPNPAPDGTRVLQYSSG